VQPRGELMPLEQTFVSIFERFAPSVAHITTRSLVSDGWYNSEAQGTGSGFLWDQSGIVVTNWHVVEGAQQVQVLLGGRTFEADVLNASPGHDLAILRLRGDLGGLAPLQLGTSKDLKVGQTVIAIGNPFGFDETMTTGIVSALNRNLRTDKGVRLTGLIQVDAAINPGNSGGPLLDSAGRLIGVNTAIYSPSHTSAGIGFAIPVDLVNDIVPRLVAGNDLTPDLGIENESNWSSCRYGNMVGAIFTGVRPGSGAAAAGLRPFAIDAKNGTVLRDGDLIYGVDGRRIQRFDDIARALRNKSAGDKVKVEFVRGLPDNARRFAVDIELTTR
jgi:S1-C subfamily serine protease